MNVISDKKPVHTETIEQVIKERVEQITACEEDPITLTVPVRPIKWMEYGKVFQMEYESLNCFTCQ